MSDLENMQIDELKKWYKTWYAPNNATLVIVGDVDTAQVKTLAEKYFTPIPSQTLPKSYTPRELTAIGERNINLALPAKVANLYMGFNVPSLTSTKNPKDVYALRMLIGVLDEGASARLESRLVRDKRIATAVNSSYNLFARGDGLLTITAIPADGYSLDQVKAAILSELNALKTEPISDDELKRVYAAILADNVFKKDSISEQANEIGMFESLGLGWRTGESLTDNLKTITADDIRQAATQWLVPANMTTLSLQPTTFTVGEAK